MRKKATVNSKVGVYKSLDYDARPIKYVDKNSQVFIVSDELYYKEPWCTNSYVKTENGYIPKEAIIIEQ